MTATTTVVIGQHVGQRVRTTMDLNYSHTGHVGRVPAGSEGTLYAFDAPVLGRQCLAIAFDDYPVSGDAHCSSNAMQDEPPRLPDWVEVIAEDDGSPSLTRLRIEIDRLAAFKAVELDPAAGQVIAFSATITTDAPLALHHLSEAAKAITTAVNEVEAALDCLKGLRDGGRE